MLHYLLHKLGLNGEKLDLSESLTQYKPNECPSNQRLQELHREIADSNYH